MVIWLWKYQILKLYFTICKKSYVYQFDNTLRALISKDTNFSSQHTNTTLRHGTTRHDTNTNFKVSARTFLQHKEHELVFHNSMASCNRSFEPVVHNAGDYTKIYQQNTCTSTMKVSWILRRIFPYRLPIYFRHGERCLGQSTCTARASLLVVGRDERGARCGAAEGGG